VPSERPYESAEEWGKRQAAKAPAWSDAKWRRVCALLRINIAIPGGASPVKEVQPDNPNRPNTEAA